MAVIVGSGRIGNDKYWLHTWADMANGDTGRPVRMSKLSDKTVTVEGTLGAAGEVTMQGSQDETTWFTLTDAQGDPLVMTALGGVLIAENPRFIRPSVTDGDGTTELTVRIGASARM